MARTSIGNATGVSVRMTEDRERAHNERALADAAEHAARDALKPPSLAERLAALEADVAALKAAAQQSTRLR